MTYFYFVNSILKTKKNCLLFTNSKCQRLSGNQFTHYNTSSNECISLEVRSLIPTKHGEKRPLPKEQAPRMPVRMRPIATGARQTQSLPYLPLPHRHQKLALEYTMAILIMKSAHFHLAIPMSMPHRSRRLSLKPGFPEVE